MLLKQQPQQQTQSLTGTKTPAKPENLETALFEQYAEAKQILEDVRQDPNVPANQKAQVLNTITTILQTLIKLQQDLQNVERLKVMESTLIDVLQKHEAIKEDFLKDYELALTKIQK